MNNLNSVLIEGTLEKDPVVSEEQCSFNVLSTRLVDKGAGTHETITVGITTTGPLAEVCAKYLKKGRGVRVLGRIAGSPFLYVHAEHVEFKPQAAQRASKEEAIKL